eukprot:295943_1
MSILSKAGKYWQMFYTLFGLFIIFNFAIIQTIFRWSDIDNSLSLVSPSSDSTEEYSMSRDIVFSKAMNEYNDTNDILFSKAMNYKSLTFNKECWDYIYLDFYNTDKNKPIPELCIIEYNTSYSIRFRIIKSLLNFLHLVESVNNWDNGAIYAIKTYPFYKQAHYEEYLTMVSLTKSCNNMHIECHTNKVYDTHYPFIRYKNENRKSYVILFMEYLANTTKYLEFEKQLWRYAELEQTLKFIDNCFHNVSIILNELWNIGLLHNDLHKENILVSDNENKCYLIDFNQMYKFAATFEDSDWKEYRGVVSITSAMHWHYLATDNDRNKFIDKYGDNSFDKLKQFGLQSQKYKINIFILEALLRSKAIHGLDVNNDRKSIKYFTKYVLNTIIINDDRRYHINSSDVVMYEKIKNIWCCRIEQIIYIIQLLKEYNNENPNVNTLSILQNMFDLYYQLKNELHYFDIICNQCILNEKYQNKNIIPKNIKYTL